VFLGCTLSQLPALTRRACQIWMGTHKAGPAHLFSSPHTTLSSVIESDPAHYLGQALLDKWPGALDVPFLFKILSIAKALPLQAHPDKELGTPSRFLLRRAWCETRIRRREAAQEGPGAVRGREPQARDRRRDRRRGGRGLGQRAGLGL
jgi:mannose-6-phosphate isomerase class I